LAYFDQLDLNFAKVEQTVKVASAMQKLQKHQNPWIRVGRKGSFLGASQEEGGWEGDVEKKKSMR